MTSVTGRPWSGIWLDVSVWCLHGRVHVWIRSRRGSCTCDSSLFFILIPVLSTRFRFSSPHPNIPPDANAATLLGHHPAEGGALRETRELLCAVDMEGLGLDFKTMGDMGITTGVGTAFVQFVLILGILELLVQTEAKPVFTLVADR